MKPGKVGNNNKTREDFGNECTGKDCAIVFEDGSTLIGKVIEVRKYYIKFMNSDGRLIYINKAHVKMMVPDKGEK